MEALPNYTNPMLANAGLIYPQVPTTQTKLIVNQRSADPSSYTRVSKYPIASFFEYRGPQPLRREVF